MNWERLPCRIHGAEENTRSWELEVTEVTNGPELDEENLLLTLPPETMYPKSS